MGKHLQALYFTCIICMYMYIECFIKQDMNGLHFWKTLGRSIHKQHARFRPMRQSHY